MVPTPTTCIGYILLLLKVSSIEYFIQLIQHSLEVGDELCPIPCGVGCEMAPQHLILYPIANTISERVREGGLADGLSSSNNAGELIIRTK